MLLFTITALADPAPPAVEPPLGITIADGATDVPTDAVPLFVYPSNGILPDDFTLVEGDTQRIVDAEHGGPSDTPTASTSTALSPNTTYTLSDATTSVTFTTGDAVALPPADAPSLANATLELPGGETGSGYYWGVDMAPFDGTLVVEVDDLPIRVITPSMPSSFSWSRADDTTPFCVAVRVRNAAGALSAPGEPLCFGTPSGPATALPTPTDVPTEPSPATPASGEPTDVPLEPAGCDSASSGTTWSWAALLRRR